MLHSISLLHFLYRKHSALLPQMGKAKNQCDVHFRTASTNTKGTVTDTQAILYRATTPLDLRFIQATADVLT